MVDKAEMLLAEFTAANSHVRSLLAPVPIKWQAPAPDLFKVQGRSYMGKGAAPLLTFFYHLRYFL